MTRFHLRSRVVAGEVCVAIGASGATASVTLPESHSAGPELRDLRLPTALQLARNLAARLGTDVGVFDERETIFFIEDEVELFRAAR